MKKTEWPMLPRNKRLYVDDEGCLNLEMVDGFGNPDGEYVFDRPCKKNWQFRVSCATAACLLFEAWKRRRFQNTKMKYRDEIEKWQKLGAWL